MTRVPSLVLVGVIATLLSWGAAGAKAQTPTAPPAAGAGAANAPAGSANGPPMMVAGAGMHSPVLVVTSIELLRSSRGGGMDIVRVRGLASSWAWREPHLLPISPGKTVDGTLDLIFQGVSPALPGEIAPLMVVEAILPIAVDHPYKAVRVRSATNAITLKTLPGYAETTTPKEDCTKCVGKYFVAKGAASPAGVAATDVVMEANIPWPVRVIKPTDGIPNYLHEPNRLTLMLTEDGRIADAAWD